MPYEMIQESPFVYEIDVRNLKGEVKHVNTNLYFLGKLLNQMNKGFSPLILICGRQRSGKSFIAQLVARWILQAYSKYEYYDPTKNTLYEPEKTIKKLGGIMEDVIVVDEAGAIMGRRQWFEQTHSALEKIIQTQGYRNFCFLFISPFGSDIDKIFLKHFDFLIRVDYRGKFKVFKILKRYDELNAYKIEKMFLDDIRYNLGDVPANVWDIYEKYSFEQKEKLRKKYSSKKQDKPIDPIDALRKALKKAGAS